MFRRKKLPPTSDNPEVQGAMDERDELINSVKAAVAKVDRLQGDLMAQYTEANGVHDDDGVH